MRTMLTWMCVLVLVASAACAEEVARPRKEELDLPAVWQAVSAQQRLETEGVAIEDADARLIARIYGMRVNADTLVMDLAELRDEVRSALGDKIRVRTAETRHTEDLTVEVTREVTLREIIETIRTVTRRTGTTFGTNTETSSDASRESRDTVISVLGIAGVPNTNGVKLAQAVRAAEMDAIRGLAEQVFGKELTRSTEVRNYLLQNDRIASNVAAAFKGAKVVDIVYRGDSCEVTLQLVLREVTETIESSLRRYAKDGKVSEEFLRTLSTQTSDKVISATGKGVVGDVPKESVGMGGGEFFQEEVTVIRRVVEREIGAL